MIFIEVLFTFSFLETSLLLLSSLQAWQFNIISSLHFNSPFYWHAENAILLYSHCPHRRRKVFTINYELTAMCQDFCLATVRNVGQSWYGHSALNYSRLRTIYEGDNICNEESLSPMGTGMEDGISSSSHKFSLLLGATGLPSGGVRVTALSRDRCHPGVPRASDHGQDTGREQQVWHCTTRQCKQSWQNNDLGCISCWPAFFPNELAS